MKLMHACLCVRRNINSSFHHCGGPLRSVCLSGGILKAVFAM